MKIPIFEFFVELSNWWNVHKSEVASILIVTILFLIKFNICDFLKVAISQLSWPAAAIVSSWDLKKKFEKNCFIKIV